MSNEEFQAELDRVMLAAFDLQDVQIDGLIQAIDRADSIASVLDPTLYAAGSDNLRAVRRVCVAVLKLRDSLRGNPGAALAVRGALQRRAGGVA